VLQHDVQTNHSDEHSSQRRVFSHLVSSKASYSIAGGLFICMILHLSNKGQKKQDLSLRGHTPRLWFIVPVLSFSKFVHGGKKTWFLMRCSSVENKVIEGSQVVKSLAKCCMPLNKIIETSQVVN
jgi:hypothetical protein